MKLLHIGDGYSKMPQSGGFYEALSSFGELKVIPDGRDMTPEERAALMREYDILLLIWGSLEIPEEIAWNRGKLKYIVNVTGELKRWVPLSIVEAGIPVTNWGDAPADFVAEGAMTLLLAVMKNLRDYIHMAESGQWGIKTVGTQTGLKGNSVGFYGMGAIGRRFVELVRPFGPVMRVYDPYAAEIPQGVKPVSSLMELFSSSNIILIFAGLSRETKKSVDAKLLSRLPDNGILINTARGGIIDQNALFAELETGRLRAGLDVLEEEWGDQLPLEHPARKLSNLILTAHTIENVFWGTNVNLHSRMYEICLDNIQRFVNNQPLRFVMTTERYKIST